MSIILLIIVFYWFYYYSNYHTLKETFSSSSKYNAKIKKIKNDIQSLQSNYVDIHAQVMTNYIMECPYTPTTTKAPTDTNKTSDEAEWDQVKQHLIQSLVTDDTRHTQKSKRAKPLLKKTRRTQYELIKKELMDESNQLHDISVLPQKIKEQKQLEAYLQCYNQA